LGRGIKSRAVTELKLREWHPGSDPAPDERFSKKYGPRWQVFKGHLAVPLFSPRGMLIGVEFRCWQGKKNLSRYLLPEAAWNPVFIGMPRAVPKMWAGGDVWIGEGLFDMGAMEHIVPETDAVLASLRAKMTQKHVEFLQRFVKGTVHMVYDRDEAGRRGTLGWVDETGKRKWGALDALKRVGVSCRDVPYNGGKDPGEVWVHSGTEGLRRAFGGIF